MMEGTPSPRADHTGGIEISDFATFQPSSTAVHSPSASHVSSNRHSFDEAEHEDLSGFSCSSPPSVEIHDDPDEPYASSAPASDDEGEDFLNDHSEDQSSSSRSSISSLPASIMPESDENTLTSTQLKQAALGRETFEERIRGSPFRHPSSVRAMQMNDELTPPSKRRAISTMLELTNPPPLSPPLPPSPTKRSNGTPQGTPKKPGFKKEYPLVLLHCKLLPPKLALPAGLKLDDERLLKDLLPEEYFNRWKLLLDLLGGSSSTVKERGILIPHPKEDYELLEERVLESLELIEPRIQNGHFLGCQHTHGEDIEDEAESVFGEGDKCHVCGWVHVDKADRKWEVKVYAATGLMREGAWDAAWKEMEKVDVEIGVWIPEEVRREIEQKVEDKISEQAFDVMEDSYVGDESDEQRRRRREIYGGLHTPTSRHTSQEHVHEPIVEEMSSEEHGTDDGREKEEPSETPPNEKRDEVEPDFQKLILNYLALLARDPKNMAILVLSVLCFYLTFFLPRAMTMPPPGVVEVAPASLSTMTECIAPSLAPSMLTTTEISTKTQFVTTTAAPTMEVEPEAGAFAPGNGEELFEL